jgi:hypothetical protein
MNVNAKAKVNFDLFIFLSPNFYLRTASFLRPMFKSFSQTQLHYDESEEMLSLKTKRLNSLRFEKKDAP